jgi:UPF0716 protein FxsA
MKLGLLLIFIAAPLLELALLIKVGQMLGLWVTLGIVVGTAIAGSMILHRQGWQVLNRAMASTARGEPPIEPVIDGTFLLFAGALLLTPGLISDAAGFALLVPAVRRWIARRLFQMIISSKSIDIKVRTSEYGTRSADDDRFRNRDAGKGPIIEGDYERLDEHRPRENGDRSGNKRQ